ncbi:hypothetical protein C7S10_03000 [Nocardioides currus]|uniref:Uncharacterized protein n=1 Tax=Nocardioides currus TaxID=2133958 RepID=A0A2R7Z394_9ACTN|nr:hypothetical protein C7S10_03000 [Nocardioides currus]
MLLAVWWRSDPTHAAEIGLWYGGIVGGVIGLVAGVVLTFAAGSHLARPVARDRAFAVATLVTALPAVLLSLPFMVHPFPFFSLVLATLVSVLAGGIARGLARAL